MKEARTKLLRLRRVERIREIARQAAAREAAEAESTLSQLEVLTQRTQVLAADYAGRTEARDGAELQQISVFSRGLQGILAASAQDAAKARVIADDKMAELGLAERRRAAVQDRAELQSQSVERHKISPELGLRKGFGTEIE